VDLESIRKQIATEIQKLSKVVQGSWRDRQSWICRGKTTAQDEQSGRREDRSSAVLGLEVGYLCLFQSTS
jgi:hypothetical protein